MTGGAPSREADPRTGTGAGIELIDLHHTYQPGTPWARPALHDINLRFPPGDRVLIIGANGSGKSTLAWILAGMIDPSAGRAVIAEHPLTERRLTEQRHRIGLVVQHTRLQLLRPTVGGELDAFTDDVADQSAALEALGFEPTDRFKRIDSLSIGQQRRVGLAVQLARRTSVLVLDEPMAGLDRESRLALAAATEALPTDTTVITVTHDLDDSKPLGNRVVHLANGRLVGDAAP